MNLERSRGIVTGLAVAGMISWAARHLLPALAPAARPVAKHVTRGVIIGYERGREMSARVAENLEDVIAEVQWELREKRDWPDLDEADLADF
jgi:hypothetical protein